MLSSRGSATVAAIPRKTARLEKALDFINESPLPGSFYNGMSVSIPLHYDWLDRNISGGKIRDVFYEWYQNKMFIGVNKLNDETILSQNGFLNPEKLKGTNNLEISVFSNEKLGQTWITSNFDNLGKGASGAAIQNMNIMFNFPENLSL